MANFIFDLQLLLVFELVSKTTNERTTVHLEAVISKWESKHYVQLNCTTCEIPINIATFLLNNKSLVNIVLSEDKCIISQQECKKEECECGPHFFFYNFTTCLKEGPNVFTCELRFNEDKMGTIKQRSVQSSVLYNSSGIYKLKEITEEKGTVISRSKNDTVNKDEEEDSGSYVVPVLSTLTAVILLVLVVAFVRWIIRRHPASECSSKNKKEQGVFLKEKKKIPKTDEDAPEQLLPQTIMVFTQ